MKNSFDFLLLSRDQQLTFCCDTIHSWSQEIASYQRNLRSRYGISRSALDIAQSFDLDIVRYVFFELDDYLFNLRSNIEAAREYASQASDVEGEREG